jgi:hypothetical protein
MEWLSETEIVVGLWWFLEDRVDTFALKIVDVTTGHATEIEGYRRELGTGQGGIPESFQGPYLSVEGNPYYWTASHRGPGAGPQGLKFAQSLDPNKTEIRAEENHILEWKEDGLYSTRGDLQESARITTARPYRRIITRTVANRDFTYAIVRGTLIRFADSSLIVLGTMVKERPPGTNVCGFLRSSFNPKHPEVLFQLSCDDGHFYVVSSIGVFNYSTNEFSLIDPIIGIENCERPSYSPDGSHIAFESAKTVYILNREARP